ncbi:hypothetical protein ERO13_D11G200933v2 [Gossypium hirsutum]|nr:hypothetical protein ERO13_D11G200933v2 [Gossypium hirsutum]
MAAVRLISTSTVHAANDRASSGTIDLNTWDIRNLQIGYIQKGLLFPKPKLPLQYNSSGNMLIHHLKTSLSHTLHCFPLLAAADGVTISDIIKPVYVPSIVHSFFSLNGLHNYKGITHPLLGIQITDLADGIFIGISKGSIYLSKPPVFQRWFPDGMDIPIRIPQSCVNVEQNNEDFILPPVRERIFHFSKENITKLKAKANAEMGTEKISSLQVLLSHIWRSAIHNRSFDPDQETNYRFVAGARQRFQEIPDNYFGNAILGTFVTMKAKELVEQGIGNSSWRMNRIIAATTGEGFKKVFECWPASPSFVTLSNGDALITSTSPRFNMYGNDFGWGKPIAIRSGSSNKFDGMLTLYCGAEEGSIDIEACFFPETLEAMANDQEFMHIVTV